MESREARWEVGRVQDPSRFSRGPEASLWVRNGTSLGHILQATGRVTIHSPSECLLSMCYMLGTE